MSSGSRRQANHNSRNSSNEKNYTWSFSSSSMSSSSLPELPTPERSHERDPLLLVTTSTQADAKDRHQHHLTPLQQKQVSSNLNKDDIQDDYPDEKEPAPAAPSSPLWNGTATPHNSSSSSFWFGLGQVCRMFWSLGWIAFGGSSVHMAILRDHLVRVNAWMDEQVFLELFSLVQGIPGPSSTQLLIGAAATKAGVAGGLLAFFIWVLPGFSVLTASGMFLYHQSQQTESLTAAVHSETSLSSNSKSTTSFWMVGVPPAAVGLICKASYEFVRKLDAFGLILGILSCIVALLINSSGGDPRIPSSQVVYPALLAAGAGATVVEHWMNRRRPRQRHDDDFLPLPPQGQTDHDHPHRGARTDIDGLYSAAEETSTSLHEQQQNELQLKEQIGITIGQGIAYFSIWLGLLIGLIVTVHVLDLGRDSQLLLLMESCYRVGSLIFGGAVVMIPLAHSEWVESKKWISEEYFFQGLGLAQSLPGPLCTFAAFLGATHAGFAGALVAEAATFAPAILWILALLPFWTHLRHLDWFQAVLAGVNASAVGLIVGGFLFLYHKSVHTAADAMVFVAAGSLAAFYNIQAPGVIASGVVFGALFAWLSIGQKTMG
ncbi:hypothetical protein ACA910_006916 [Epithemia clementina (nom. ined.)]